MDGVWRVNAGYAGGLEDDPTYHSLGGHTETVRIEYDPAKITYRELLEAFFAGHDAHARPWSRQYASLILYAGEDQRREAEAFKERLEAESGRRVSTEIAPLVKFHPAEDYHQKYYLRRHPEVAAEFIRAYPDPDQFRNSTAAARANAILGGYGNEEDVRRLAGSLGLSDKSLAALSAAVRRFTPRCAL